MANEPTKVTFLDGNGREILTVEESEKNTMNGKGSENTRSVRIDGPQGCVVTCFDDQLWRMGQNSVTITKTVSDEITVPIATNFVQGAQHNGVFFGEQPEYKWQLNKAIEQQWWEPILDTAWEGLDAFLKTIPELHLLELADGAIKGYVLKDGNTSSNNHVDNMSSIKFGISGTAEPRRQRLSGVSSARVPAESLRLRRTAVRP